MFCGGGRGPRLAVAQGHSGSGVGPSPKGCCGRGRQGRTRPMASPVDNGEEAREPWPGHDHRPPLGLRRGGGSRRSRAAAKCRGGGALAGGAGGERRRGRRRRGERRAVVLARGQRGEGTGAEVRHGAGRGHRSGARPRPLGQCPPPAPAKAQWPYDKGAPPQNVFKKR